MSNETELSFESIMQMLQDAEQPLGTHFLFRLSDLEGAELALFEQTWQRMPVLRRQAVMEDIEALGERDYVLSFEAVARIALQDKDDQVRELAIRCLYEYENTNLIPRFLALTIEDPASTVRAAAASALGQYVYKGELEEIPTGQLDQIVDMLLQVYRSTDSMLVRRRALESLGYSSCKEAADIIEVAYQTGHNDWMVSALFAMGRSANQKWGSKVSANLDHEVPEVRLEAARAAGELEIVSAVDALLDLLGDEDPDVRLAAAWSLSQIGGQGVQEALEELYEEAQDDEEAEFIEAAMDNLAFTEDLNIFSLMEYLEDDDETSSGDERHGGFIDDDDDIEFDADEDESL